VMNRFGWNKPSAKRLIRQRLVAPYAAEIEETSLNWSIKNLVT